MWVSVPVVFGRHTVALSPGSSSMPAMSTTVSPTRKPVSPACCASVSVAVRMVTVAPLSRRASSRGRVTVAPPGAPSVTSPVGSSGITSSCGAVVTGRPYTAIFSEWSLASHMVAPWARCRRPSPMLHPAAAPLSSAFDCVSGRATVPAPDC